MLMGGAAPVAATLPVWLYYKSNVILLLYRIRFLNLSTLVYEICWIARRNERRDDDRLAHQRPIRYGCDDDGGGTTMHLENNIVRVQHQPSIST